MGAPLAVTFTGLRFENPFLLASAPPTESDSNIMRAFDAGWGGVVTKTIGLHPVVNVDGPKTKFLRSTPDSPLLSMKKRPGTALHSSWNWELISDKPLDWWIPKIARIKAAFPDRILVASIMAGSGSDEELRNWQELATACQDEGADALELNLSCPHMDRKDMGSNIGKDTEQISIVTHVVKEVARVPIWAKLTPSTTDIVVEARGAFLGGADAISSSNTFPSLPPIDPDTLEFEMNVDGYVSSGGMGGPAILPMSMAKMAQMTQAFPDKAFSGIGGVADFSQALNYFLLGCGTVQVCTAAMLDHAIGPNVIRQLTTGMQQAMEKNGWSVVERLPRAAPRPRGDPLEDPSSGFEGVSRRLRRGRLRLHLRQGHGGRGNAGADCVSIDFVEVTEDLSAQPPLESRPRADAAVAPHVVHVSHRRALDRHERGDHHLHARLRPHAAGHDVAAGDADDPARQRHRAGPDDPERSCRHQVRRVVSGAVPRQLWRARGKRAGDPAGAGGLRLVRDSDVDWRPGAEHAAHCCMAGLERHPGERVDLVRTVLGRAGVDHRPRTRGHQEAGRLVGAAAPRRRCAAADVGGRRGGGIGYVLDQSVRLQTSHAPFWQLFPAALTANVGYWATLSLNIPDFTRYARSQRSQALGQALGLPATMTAFAFIGVAVTSATIVIYGEAIWDPVALIARIGSPAVIIFGALVVLLAQLTTNMAANVVSPANDFSSLSPRRISYVTGGLITALVGILMMPWKLYADAASYIFTWLIGYSSLMGAIGGILIADYWVVRRRDLSLPDLFRVDGRYSYRNGVNRHAMMVLIIAILPVIPGFIRAATTPNGQVANPTFFDSVYTYAWFVTFGLSFALYLVVPASRRTL